MADEKATFAIVLEDETSGAANAAAASLESLRGKIAADTKALSQLSKAMRQMKAAGLQGSDSFKQLAGQAAALKAKIGTNQEAFVKLGGTFDAVAPKAAGLGSAFAGAGGPLGALSGGVGKLGALLTSPVALVAALTVGVVALAVGMAKLAGAVIGAVGSLVKFGAAASGARRSEALQIEGLNTLRQAYGRQTASVEDYQAAIDRASDSTNIGRSTLQGYARSLSRAGLRGDALTESVEAMGIAAMVQGDRGANRFRALAMNARLTGGSVSDLAARYRDELGPLARRTMLSLDNQTTKFNKNLERLFGGLNTEPMLSALDEVGNLLSQSNEAGKALKSLFEALFQPIVDEVGEASPMITAFFEGMVIGALVAGIGIMRLRNQLDAVFPGFLGDANAAKIATFAGIAAFAIFIGTILLAVVAVGLLALALFLVLLPFILIIGAIGLLAAGIILMIEGFIHAMGAIADFVSDMIDGIVNAITGETPRVEAAFNQLAEKGAKGFSDALGIASPSRVFAEFGRNITEGAVSGVEAGAGDLENATANLVDEPAGGGLGGGGASISIGEVVVNAGESSDPRALAMAFRDELAAVLEGVNIELGSQA